MKRHEPGCKSVQHECYSLMCCTCGIPNTEPRCWSCHRPLSRCWPQPGTYHAEIRARVLTEAAR